MIKKTKEKQYKNKKINVVVPAYNEQENIKNLLLSIVDQETDDLQIDNIIVVTDGCTDKTVEIVKELKIVYSKIILKNYKTRKGKVYRLNQIFEMNDSEILIIFDADILLGNKKVIFNLCKALISDKKISLAAAHQIPLKGNTLVSKLIYVAYKIWDDTRLSLPNYLHIQNFYGAATAYRLEFVRTLKIPSSVTDERGYIFLKANEKKGFRYIKSAIVYYMPVQSIYEMRKLSDRSFNKNQIILSKIFGEKVFDIYKIPSKYKIYSIIKNFFRDPIFTTLAIILNIFIRIYPLHDELYDKRMWEQAKSTKRLLNYE